MKWSNNLPSPRADIEAVARVISRRSQRQFRVEQNWLTDRSERYLLFDLSSSNLQRLSFAGTAFSNTSFKGAFLDGASFDECTFAVCDFSASSGVSTSFYNSNFHDCNFSAANLEISNLNGGFSACSFQNADLGGVIANAATFLEVDFWRRLLLPLSLKERTLTNVASSIVISRSLRATQVPRIILYFQASILFFTMLAMPRLTKAFF